MKYFILIFSLFFLTCENPNEPEIFGCTDVSACNYNSEATILDINSCKFSDSLGGCCFLEEKDECDICNGEGIAEDNCDCIGNTLDECGICNGEGIAEGSCNCAGDILDCNDDCGGLAAQDCNGICGGDSSLDICGVCQGDGTSCLGCDGVANSGLIFDECGICNGSGLNSDGCCAEEVIDCNNTCGGNAEYNQCAECDTDCSCFLDWNMIWSDEFDGEGINLDYWNFEVWGPGQVNNEEQAYTASPNNASIESGNLVITALRENLDLNNDGTPDSEYSSARLTTANKFSTVYDNVCGDCDGGKVKVEVRAKLPKGTGTWPAIWMMPNNSEYGGWPSSGEIDIMEHVGYDSNVIHSSVHNATNSGSLGGTNQTSNQNVSDVEENYHTYGLIWSDKEILTYVDSEENILLDYDNPELSNYEVWPYDKEFFIILNLAIGGTWGGVNGIDSSIFPEHMYIDYVRVYKLNCQ